MNMMMMMMMTMIKENNEYHNDTVLCIIIMVLPHEYNNYSQPYHGLLFLLSDSLRYS